MTEDEKINHFVLNIFVYYKQMLIPSVVLVLFAMGTFASWWDRDDMDECMISTPYE